MTTNVSPAVLQAGAQLTTAAVAYVTGAASVQTIIKRVVFTNTTATAVPLTVYRVPSGGTAGATNEIISGRSVPANGTDLAPELANLVLNAGETIQAMAGAAAAVNVFASGFVAS